MKKKWLGVIGVLVIVMAAVVWIVGKEEKKLPEQAIEKNKPVAEQIDSVKEHVADKEAESKETKISETSEETTAQPAEESAPQITEIPAEANELLKEAEKAGEASGQTTAPKAETDSTGSGAESLNFGSREEAMQFVFSRFSKEEVALYNQASASGLTAEQQQMALQIAYSRFSAEEIAAIEAALK